MIRDFCLNCYEEIISEPIVSEKEINTLLGDVEADVPVIIYFCSKECEKEYFNEKTNGND